MRAWTSSIREYDIRVGRHWRSLRTRPTFSPWEIVEQTRVSAYRYDCLLSENVVTIELFDASANNVIVECIARNTPIVVNRHPAVVAQHQVTAGASRKIRQRHRIGAQRGHHLRRGA